jgi:hypothetical protein
MSYNVDKGTAFTLQQMSHGFGGKGLKGQKKDLENAPLELQ